MVGSCCLEGGGEREEETQRRGQVGCNWTPRNVTARQSDSHATVVAKRGIVMQVHPEYDAQQSAALTRVNV